MFERSRKKARTIPLTPLIDVVFLLIVFFMLSTSFVMSESMELLLPSARASATEEEVPPRDIPLTMELVVQTDGSLLYNESRLQLEEFEQLVKMRIEEEPDQPFVLIADEGVNVQQLIKAMDVAYGHGARQVQMDCADVDAPVFMPVGQEQ